MYDASQWMEVEKKGEMIEMKKKKKSGYIDVKSQGSKGYGNEYIILLSPF